jgi:hypothetical protein
MAQQITFKIEVSPNSFLYIATQPNASNTPLPLGLSHNPTSYKSDCHLRGDSHLACSIKRGAFSNASTR